MGRNVLVTGSSHGIGAAVAIAFAKQGDNVGITYLKSPEGAKAVQEECLKYGVDAQIFQVDLSVREQCEKLMQDFLAHYETIDVLINNAGGALQIPKGEFEDMPLDYWDSQIALNLNACAYCAHAAVENMKKHKTPGRIVNISSASVRGIVGQTNYAATKAALVGFSNSLAKEVAAKGVTVNCVAPGATKTAMYDAVPEDVYNAMLAANPMKRLGKPEEIGEVVAFVASERASYLNGQWILVNGGK